MIDYEPRRWRSHFFDVRGTMLREILYRVMFCAVAAVVAVVLRRLGHTPHLPDEPHLFVGPALALLLVFRTNTANDRYWEGRKLWGSIVNAARNLDRKARSLLVEHRPLAEAVIDFCWATRARLGGTIPTAATALAAAARMTDLVTTAQRGGAITDVQQAMLDRDVSMLVDCLGGCERIALTPLPFAYVVHLRRALLLYCGTLPFVLVETFGVYTIPATLFVSYILLGIEEIGMEIENPFGNAPNHLQIDRICTSLEATLRREA